MMCYNINFSSCSYLWRHKYSQAISKHYRRFDVFEEGLANMVAGKYDNASIIRQLEFYKNEGLTPYSAAKLPIESGMNSCLSLFTSKLTNQTFRRL